MLAGTEKFGVVITVSKAYNNETSFVYAREVDKKEFGGFGRPFQLSTRSNDFLQHVWANDKLADEHIEFGTILKYEQIGNDYLYTESTEFRRQDVIKIQIDLAYGRDVFKGIKDALPEAKFSPRKGIYQDSGSPPELPVFLVSITSGEMKNERITFTTKNGESVNLKLNCRENLMLSPSPIKLQMGALRDACDVGDFIALIKMGNLESGLRNPTYEAVCEGLIIRYKAKVISINEEPVEIMDGNGEWHQLELGTVKFDTGNDVATGISQKLLDELHIEPSLVKKRKVTVAGGSEMLCGPVEISIVIRGFTFSGIALVNAVGPNTDLLVGMDVIKVLGEKKFTLGTP